MSEGASSFSVTILRCMIYVPTANSQWGCVVPAEIRAGHEEGGRADPDHGRSLGQRVAPGSRCSGLHHHEEGWPPECCCGRPGQLCKVPVGFLLSCWLLEGCALLEEMLEENAMHLCLWQAN